MREICGRRLTDFEELPAQGTRGGIIVAWNPQNYTKVKSEIGRFSITVHLRHNCGTQTLAFTAVYGPTNQREREAFFGKLRHHKPHGRMPWIIGGDFNATAAPRERTSDANTWRSTLAFAGLISELELLNLALVGKKYTWSNDQAQPHMARLDRFLISAEWNSLFPNSVQRAVANTSSDHCPLVLTAKTDFRRSRFFRFENVWLRFAPFHDLVRLEWAATPTATNPKDLNIKLNSLKHKITVWAKEKMGNVKAQTLICREFLA